MQINPNAHQQTRTSVIKQKQPQSNNLNNRIKTKLKQQQQNTAKENKLSRRPLNQTNKRNASYNVYNQPKHQPVKHNTNQS